MRRWIAESEHPETILQSEKQERSESCSNRSTDASNESTNSAKTDRPPLETIHEGIIHAVSAVQNGIVNLPSGILAHAESVFSIADAWNTATSCSIQRSPSKSRASPSLAVHRERDCGTAKPGGPATNRSDSPSLSRKDSGALTEQRLPSYHGSSSTAAATSSLAAAAGGGGGGGGDGGGNGLSRSSSLRSTSAAGGA